MAVFALNGFSKQFENGQVQNRSKLLQTCFFVLTTQILICDLGELLTQVIVAFPLSLYGANVSLICKSANLLNRTDLTNSPSSLFRFMKAK